jgi:hypothetical protein
LTPDQSLGITSSSVILIWLLLKTWVNTYGDGDGDTDCRSCCCPRAGEDQVKKFENRKQQEQNLLNGNVKQEDLPELKKRDAEFVSWNRGGGEKKAPATSGLLIIPMNKNEVLSKRPQSRPLGGVVL